jgi:hypothetical protein
MLMSQALRSLYLSSNEFSGVIPDSLFENSYAMLGAIDFSNNQFSGPIPESLSKASQLFSLNFANNLQLNGTIPASLTRLPDMQYFYLFQTAVSGPLPSNFSRWPLRGLTLSFQPIQCDRYSYFAPPNFTNPNGMCLPCFHDWQYVPN